MIEPDKNREIFSLSSNDGWNFIRFNSSSEIFGEDTKFISGELHMSGNFWNRHQTILQNSVSENLTEDFSVCFRQIIVKLQSLKSLSEMFSSCETDRNIDLCPTEESQQCSLVLKKKHEHVISSRKPVLLFSYRMSRLKGELIFVTDQSCLQIAAEGIDKWLKSHNADQDNPG